MYIIAIGLMGRIETDTFRCGLDAFLKLKSKYYRPLTKHMDELHTDVSFRIAKTAGRIVLEQNGVVRGVSNWGTFLLPKPAKKLQSTHHYGHHFIMRFDSSSRTQHSLRKTMSLDPRLIRYSIVKMGTKFEEIKDITGNAEFR